MNKFCIQPMSLQLLKKIFPQRSGDHNVVFQPMRNIHNTSVIVVSSGGLRPTCTEILSSKHVSYILTFNIAEKTLFISKNGSSSILDFARQAICSSGLTKIAPLSVI